MNKLFPPFIILLLLIISSLFSCKEDSQVDTPPADDFDRKALLTDWADLIIIPAYTHYVSKLDELRSSRNDFQVNPDATGLSALRSAWVEAYKAWQKVSLFEIGKAESIGLRSFTNIYPTDTDKILTHIQTGDYNLELPSNFDVQGFPALDFLLFGTAETESEIFQLLATPAYTNYLGDLIDRLHSLTNEVLEDWENGYREEFINNSGSSATSSLDKLVNDFLFYYERFLRAGKIGIPAGVFSGSSSGERVEAPYSGAFSKTLFQLGLDAVQDFFNGKSFDGQTFGEGLSSYLDYLETIVPRDNLSERINAQFDAAKTKASGLQDNLKTQVETDNTKMLETYDELQKVVPLLKVEMLQALNIRVDFVDADGD